METLLPPGEKDMHFNVTLWQCHLLLGCRTLLSSELGDEMGELTVGGQTTSDFYTGALQDVRVYLGVLQLR